MQAEFVTRLQVFGPQSQHLAVKALSRGNDLGILPIVVNLVCRNHVSSQFRAATFDHMPVHFEVHDGLDSLFRVAHPVLMVFVSPVRLFRNQRLEMHLRYGHRWIQAREVLEAREDRSHGVVVFGRDRIEFVIVAASAAHREPHEDLRRRVDLFINHVVLHLDLVLLNQRLCPHCQETGCNDAPAVDPIRPLGRQQITGELLDDKLIERRVPVQSLDDVVAVAPGVRHLDVIVQTGRVRVAGDIEPVATPLFAVPRGVQESIDQPPERTGDLVCQEFLDFSFRGSQAVKVVLGPSQ